MVIVGILDAIPFSFTRIEESKKRHRAKSDSLPDCDSVVGIDFNDLSEAMKL